MALEPGQATYPPLVAAGAPLTYTLRLTNSGNVDLHAAITDTLPAHIVPGGVLTWTAEVAPTRVWTETVVVGVEPGYAGGLVNEIRAGSLEGATGLSTGTVFAEVPIAGLAATNDSPTELGSPTTLTATIAAGSNVSYAWAFGDADYGSGAVVAHTYPAVGIYATTVTATNGAGSATATTTVTVTITPPVFRIYLPLILRAG